MMLIKMSGLKRCKTRQKRGGSEEMEKIKKNQLVERISISKE